MLTPELIHYGAAGLVVFLGGLGGGLGQGFAGGQAMFSFLRQPLASEKGFHAMVIGLAVIESGCIIALVSSLLILIGAPDQFTMPLALAEVGMALSVGVAAVVIGMASSVVVQAAIESIARQPFFSQKIITLMLLTQSIIEAPLIFAFIVAITIKTNLAGVSTLAQGLQLLAAGLAIAVGTIGPSIGQGLFARTANQSVGLNKNAYGKIFPFTLVCEAIIETPMIFCLLFAFLIIYAKPAGGVALSIGEVIPFFVASFTIGAGALGGSIAIGKVASKSCLAIAQEPKNYSHLFRSTLLAIAFIESTVIYALIVSFFLILRVT